MEFFIDEVKFSLPTIFEQNYLQVFIVVFSFVLECQWWVAGMFFTPSQARKVTSLVKEKWEELQ